jgi:hypothetical protein
VVIRQFAIRLPGVSPDKKKLGWTSRPKRGGRGAVGVERVDSGGGNSPAPARWSGERWELPTGVRARPGR